MMHKQRTIPEHRRAPDGMFRTRKKIPGTDEWGPSQDVTLEQLPELFGRDPDVDVYDSTGKRVGRDGMPQGSSEI